MKLFCAYVHLINLLFLVIHFVTDTTASPSHRNSNDHYYEQDWSVPEDSVTIPTKSSRKHQQLITSISNQQILLESSLTSSSPDVLTANQTRTSPPRGRISRLKPKEDTSYAVQNNCSSNEMIISSAYSIVGGDALTANAAGVKLCQDNPQALLEKDEVQNILHFPVIDDSKPFVCQQCGLAFSREKAMVSHTKVNYDNIEIRQI